MLRDDFVNKILDKIKTITQHGIHVPGPFTISKLGLILNT